MSVEIEPSAFRLTFNLPASKHYFGAEDDGIRIKIDGPDVYFKSCRNIRRFPEAVRAERRGVRAQDGHSGLRLVLKQGDGSQVLALCRLFESRTAGHTKPFFFFLRQAQDGWAKLADLFTDDKPNPPKPEPHVRFWPPEEAVRSNSLHMPEFIHDAYATPSSLARSSSDEIERDLGETFVKFIRDGDAKAREFRMGRVPGRPPGDVTKFERTRRSLLTLAREIDPHAFSPAQAKTIMDVCERIQCRALEHQEQMRSLVTRANELLNSHIELVRGGNAKILEIARGVLDAAPTVVKFEEAFSDETTVALAPETVCPKVAEVETSPGTARPVRRIEEGVSGLKGRKRTALHIAPTTVQSAAKNLQDDRVIIPEYADVIAPSEEEMSQDPQDIMGHERRAHPRQNNIAYLDPNKISRELSEGLISSHNSWRTVRDKKSVGSYG